jgi:enoyl-CoA hydratase/carnithine racemase
MSASGDVQQQALGHVTVVEIRRPPHNFLDPALVASLADAFEYLDAEDECRVVVLAACGESFCAGADFQGASGGALFWDDPEAGGAALYRHALRLFRTRKTLVAAVHGPAMGGGLGLALAADFRVGCERMASAKRLWYQRIAAMRIIAG